MSLLDDASLIITPNAYKESKLYSIKPTDGSGDLDVVRATSATRVDENGLIETPRTNLLLRSEEFDNIYWSKFQSSVESNATIAPNGLLMADKLVENNTTNFHSIFISSAFSVISGQTYTRSVYAKADGRNWISLLLVDSTQYRAFFDLQNGIIGSVDSGISATIKSVGNGWYRCSVTRTVTTSLLGSVAIELALNNNIGSYLGNGTSGVFIWGSQLEQGVTATEYIPTTNSIRTKFAGITQDGGSASNIPRLDYSNGSCPSILVEQQRTNLALQSEEFDNATSWTPQNIILTSNSITSPSGFDNAETITDNVTLGVHNLYAASGNRTLSTSGSSYTYSIFIKAGTRRYVGLGVGSGGSGVHMFIDTTNFTATEAKTFGINTNWVYLSNSITALANNWYRCSLTIRTDAVLTLIPSFFLSNVSTSTSAEPSYIGDGSNAFIWGAQLEVGSNATSYIPTTTASVTRNADVISKTGLSGITTITETFEDDTTNVISGSPTSYTMSQGRIKQVIGE